MSDLSRREFLGSAAGAAAFGTMTTMGISEEKPAGALPRGLVAVSSANGLRTTERAVQRMEAGEDPLDAAIAGVNIVEEDPEDTSVGYGGLPNEDGVVELDSCVMHGPTWGAGAVAALRHVKTPSRVAKLVMERTDHVLLVGEGALRFARAHGFKEEDLLTDNARKIWLDWKERHSEEDDWLPPPEVPDPKKKQSRASNREPFTYGTITCLAVNKNGDIGGVTTTSGLSFKIPGRVGDSPLIGAGLYVDNNVGAAGSTGRGEAVIKVCGSKTVVEAMRAGQAPTQACLHALQRIVDSTLASRLRHEDGRPNFDVKLYALARDGRFGAASIWSGAKYAVCCDGRHRLEECAFLFERKDPPK